MSSIDIRARRLILVHQTGRITLLSSAQGTDLSALQGAGVYTIAQLLQRKDRPLRIDEDLWQRLRKEAAAFMNVNDA